MRSNGKSDSGSKCRCRRSIPRRRILLRKKNADNFTAEQLCDAVRFCHYSGVKVYVTLNTLVFDREIPLLAKAIENCAKADVDAFIVQDMGVARLARQIVPEIPLHASTQMTVNSPEGAIMAKELDLPVLFWAGNYRLNR